MSAPKLPAQVVRVLVLAAALLGSAASAQVFIYPRRANKTPVRYFQFDWRHIDILVGPKASGEADTNLHEMVPLPGGGGSSAVDAPKFATSLGERSGGVRLYFYGREQTVAERAAASIADTYRKLVEKFRYVPTETFPYILYNSYQEFLQTNLFPVQEGVLGVTSPQDLKLTLPYQGDQRMFEEISAHEMAHQFTIQKLRTVVETGQHIGDPLMRMPLWFIEGLAEFYAHDGLDPEAEMLIRDLLINPAVAEGYAMLDFFEDRPFSVLWTYKAGNVRCAFLEETYGEGFLQRVLDQSVLLLPGQERPALEDFVRLLEELTGDDRRTLGAKFDAWLKRRSYRSYLDSEQASDAFESLTLPGPERLSAETVIVGTVSTFTSSPDGELLLLRTIEPEVGDSRLILVHRQVPGAPKTVAVDGVPGVESLHPIASRNFDLASNRLVFVAEAGARDVLYVQDVEVKVKEPEAEEEREVRLSLGARRAIELGAHGLLAAYSPALSPDARQVAFVAMRSDGRRDVYRVDLEAEDPAPVRLTDDPHSERQLAWGKEGIVFTSDATSHRRYNLFRLRPDAPGEIERLTTEPRDEFDPEVLPDGRILFTAYDAGRADLHEVVNGQIIRRTSVVTGLFDSSAGPDGAVWALLHHGGRRRPVLVPREKLLAPEGQPQEPGEPAAIPERIALSESQLYRPLALRNWELGPVFGLLGGGTGGILGQLVASASDRLANHALVLDVSILGSFELTDGYLLYVNQVNRVLWGFGPFQSLRFRQDKTFDGLPFRFTSGERFYGGLASARYPFNRYLYVQADAAVGGVGYFLLEPERIYLSTPNLNGTGRDLLTPWSEANARNPLQAEGTLRFGYDTLRYHFATGPVSGSSVLVEGTSAVQPGTDELFGNVRLDAERYFALEGRSNFFLRVGAGSTFGGKLAREFFLSSFDTLRGVPFGDDSRLLGRNFAYSTAELQFPLNSLVRVLFLNDIEAVLGADFGGVGQDWRDAWDRRVLDLVVGANLGLGPLVFRLHFAKNIGVGAPVGLPVHPAEWVTNFSIGIAGLGGLFADQHRVAPLLVR